ncbi:hypothetical protein ACLB2K_038519 [Fragaria x ananassa]
MAQRFCENSLENEAYYEPRINLDRDQEEEQGESFTYNMVEVSGWDKEKRVNHEVEAFAALEGEHGVIDTPLIPVREQFSFQVRLVFFISERYALPPNTTCSAEDIPLNSASVTDIPLPCSREMGPVPAQDEAAPHIEITSSIKHKQTLTFSTPTLDMASNMRPLYITTEVEGKMVNKVMVDTGAAVNIITTRTMGLLDIPRSMIKTMSLTVKNFNEQHDSRP